MIACKEARKGNKQGVRKSDPSHTHWHPVSRTMVNLAYPPPQLPVSRAFGFYADLVVVGPNGEQHR